MVVRQPRLRAAFSSPIFSNLLSPLPSSSSRLIVPTICTRCMSQKKPPNTTIPPPIPFVPDTLTFLTLIGRGLSKHASKFPTWDSLFTVTSPQLRELGIEPTRARRYLLRWREKYRRGEFGVGGDLQHVKDGMGEIRVVEIPRLKPWLSKPPKSTAADGDGQSEAADDLKEDDTLGASALVSPGMVKLPVNLPVGQTEPPTTRTEELKKVKEMKLHMGCQVRGPYLELVKGTKGTVGVLKVQEGLWEHKRGHKVDGGERRKAEVRFKRAVEERKKERG